MHTMAVPESVSHASTYTDKHHVVQKRSARSAQDENETACLAAPAGQVAVPSSAPRNACVSQPVFVARQ